MLTHTKSTRAVTDKATPPHALPEFSLRYGEVAAPSVFVQGDVNCQSVCDAKPVSKVFGAVGVFVIIRHEQQSLDDAQSIKFEVKIIQKLRSR